ISIVGSGPARGRNGRVSGSRALLPCLALTALFPVLAIAQTVTPDMLRPVRSTVTAPPDSLLRRTAPERAGEAPPDLSAEERPRNPGEPAPSRIGRIPTYGVPAANGAAE